MWYHFVMEPCNQQNQQATAWPACGSVHRQIKYGKNSTGKPQYQCYACKRRYVQDPQTNALDRTLRTQAVRLHLEGNNFRRTARLLGVNHQTVINWIRQEEVAQPSAPLPANTIIIEMDELYALHQKRAVVVLSDRHGPGNALSAFVPRLPGVHLGRSATTRGRRAESQTLLYRRLRDVSQPDLSGARASPGGSGQKRNAQRGGRQRRFAALSRSVRKAQPLFYPLGRGAALRGAFVPVRLQPAAVAQAREETTARSRTM